jgi:hypothetical protein
MSIVSTKCHVRHLDIFRALTTCIPVFSIGIAIIATGCAVGTYQWADASTESEGTTAFTELDLQSQPDLEGECEAVFCPPEFLGECRDYEGCEDSTRECVTTHEFAPVGMCAFPSAARASEHEDCETFDASGMQTCEPGLTCWGPRDLNTGACHEWCAEAQSMKGTCTTAGDICLRFKMADAPLWGGYCVRECDPRESTPCDHTPNSRCMDVGRSDVFDVSTTATAHVVFACVPSLDGDLVERTPCAPLLQHYPAGFGEPLASRCAAGLTCAFHQYADQPVPLYQCLRVCDAPEDCLPTETCVSSLEFTESVGEPVGVCEVL